MDKYVFILEPDSKFQNELKTAVEEFGINYKTILFSKIEDLKKILNTIKENGLTKVLGAEEVELSLFILAAETLGAKPVETIKSLIDLGQPTQPRIVVSTFESHQFKMKHYKDKVVSNILFKPYDKLIVKQHLEFVIEGHKPLENYTIQNQETSAKVEMLKDINLTNINEIGFSTSSNRPLTAGGFSKYYGEFFDQSVSNNFYARAEKSVLIAEGAYNCHFEFFALTNEQIGFVRRLIFGNNQKNKSDAIIRKLLFEEKDGALPVQFLIIDKTVNPDKTFDFILDNSFAQSKTIRFEETGEALNSLKNTPQAVDAIIMSVDIFREFNENALKTFIDQIKANSNTKNEKLSKDIPIFLISNKIVVESEVRKFAPHIKDIFYFPFDRIYIQKKIQHHVQIARFKEDKELHGCFLKSSIQAANPVQATKISEAGLFINYDREIEIHEFRKFVMWMPNTPVLPQFLSICNYSKEGKAEKGGKVFEVHFVFFGMSDYYLKYMRVWLLHNYVESKGEPQ